MSAELAIPDRAAELAGLYEARAALECSRDLGKIMHIHDTALAAKRYAEAKKLGAEMTGYAQEIVNRAERRIGQLLTETPPEPGRRSDLVPEGNEVATRRQQIGSRKLSARAQCLAELPDEDFEKLVTKPVTRLARIARDRRAEQRRKERAKDFEAIPLPDACIVTDAYIAEARRDLEQCGWRGDWDTLVRACTHHGGDALYVDELTTYARVQRRYSELEAQAAP